MTSTTQPVHVLCRYLVKPGQERAFAELLDRHWGVLRDAGLTTEQPARVIRCKDRAGNSAFVEVFSWANPGAVQTAHQDARVMKLWEPMGALCENMEFWNAETIKGESLWG